MTSIVIDASVTLSWCFPDEQTAASLGVLDRLNKSDRALVPSFWAVEVLNILLVGERRGRITAQQSQTFFNTLLELDPAVDHLGLDRVSSDLQVLCRNHRLTPYDALYVELAWRAECPLATLDEHQRKAAEQLGVICL